MIIMRKATTLQISRQAFEKAVIRAQPVTVSYMQEEKDDKTGKRTGRKDVAGNLVLIETVRTIEPYEVAETKAGNLIVKAMDRATGERRTFRLDRLVSWTTHRTAFLIKRPTNLKEVVMAKDTGAPVSEPVRNINYRSSKIWNRTAVQSGTWLTVFEGCKIIGDFDVASMTPGHTWKIINAPLRFFTYRDEIIFTIKHGVGAAPSMYCHLDAAAWYLFNLAETGTEVTPSVVQDAIRCNRRTGH